MAIVIADNYVNFARKDIVHAFRSIYPNRNVQMMEDNEQCKVEHE